MQVIVDGRVWIDKEDLSEQQEENLKGALTVFPSKTSEYETEDPDPIPLWAERDGMLGVPRGFFEEKSSTEHKKIYRVSDGTPMGKVESLMSFGPPYEEQTNAIEKAIKYTEDNEYGGWILKAGCGFGKTNVALEIAHRIGRRTLILVHKEFFLRQWKERIEDFFPDAKVGLIRQNKCDYVGCDFVIGMMQSLARDDGAKYPEEIYSAFGLVISDECHRVGAQTWANLLPKFNARWRMGLTATPRRKDDAEDVFFHHIGKIFYKAQTRPLVPMVRRVYTDSRLKPKRGRTTTDRMPSAQVLSQLTRDEFRNRQIADEVTKAVKKGRKVMIISERLEHLRLLSEHVASALVQLDLDFEPTLGVYTGEYYVAGTDKKKKLSEAELKLAESGNVILATKQMVEEGLDIQALDVIVLATPMSDVEQTVGRVRRTCKPSKDKCKRLCPWRAGRCTGKPHPIVVDVIDEKVPQAKRKWTKRHAFYESIGSL